MSKAKPAPDKGPTDEHPADTLTAQLALEIPGEELQTTVDTTEPLPVAPPSEPSPGEQGMLKLVRLQAHKAAQIDHPVATLNVAQLSRLAAMYGTTPAALAGTLVTLQAMSKADLPRVQDAS